MRVQLGDNNKKFIGLSESEAKKRFEHIADELKENETTADEDYRHAKKRRLSFTILDCLIDYCVNAKKCPPIELRFEHYLIDISIERYIEDRAYFYSIDKIGTNDKNRYRMAEDRIKAVLECPNACRLGSKLFVGAIKDIMNEDLIRSGTKNRKAFWTYLKFKPNNNPKTDYEGAAGFVKKFHLEFFKLLQNKEQKQTRNWNHMKSFVENHRYILNGFELFQACAIKNILGKSPSSVSSDISKG